MKPLRPRILTKKQQAVADAKEAAAEKEIKSRCQGELELAWQRRMASGDQDSIADGKDQDLYEDQIKSNAWLKEARHKHEDVAVEIIEKH